MGLFDYFRGKISPQSKDQRLRDLRVRVVIGRDPHFWELGDFKTAQVRKSSEEIEHQVREAFRLVGNKSYTVAAQLSLLAGQRMNSEEAAARFLLAFYSFFRESDLRRAWRPVKNYDTIQQLAIALFGDKEFALEVQTCFIFMCQTGKHIDEGILAQVDDEWVRRNQEPT